MEIIAAFTENRVIGVAGEMPWHLPADLAHFKKLTTGHAVVMGRRTWESIGRALPNRLNIVVTRQLQYEAKEATIVHSLEDAIQAAGSQSVFVIGGSEMYAQAIPLATRMHLTRIHTIVDGDTFFPDFDTTQWNCHHSCEYPADEKNPFTLTFETWM